MSTPAGLPAATGLRRGVTRGLALWCLALVWAACEVGAGPAAEGTRTPPEPATTAAGGSSAVGDEEPTRLSVEVLRTLPHSTRSYTQGLLIHEGLVYESRGQYRHSGIDVWDPETGEILRSVDLPADLFGEGLARIGTELWQLTWQAGRALRWDMESLELLGEARFAGEGWGLEYDGTKLLLSDGSQVLYHYDPRDFSALGEQVVQRGSRPQDLLNELEYVAEHGALYANLYQTDEIVRIDPVTGRVTGVADLSGLLEADEAARADVLNGIAWWPERQSFLVTGKHWPKSFEVRFSSP